MSLFAIAKLVSASTRRSFFAEILISRAQSTASNDGKSSAGSVWSWNWPFVVASIATPSSTLSSTGAEPLIVERMSPSFCAETVKHPSDSSEKPTGALVTTCVSRSVVVKTAFVPFTSIMMLFTIGTVELRSTMPETILTGF